MKHNKNIAKHKDIEWNREGEKERFVDVRPPFKTQKDSEIELMSDDLARHQKPGFFDANSSKSDEGLEAQSSKRTFRARSSLRLKYEAEVELIRRKIGELDEIRAQLGLSQRKMCQLLLVDPSAWTRWTRREEGAPPHVYRMLQWYLALEEKYPALDVNFWLQTVAQTRKPEDDSVRDKRLLELASDQAHLLNEIEKLRAFHDQALVSQVYERQKLMRDLTAKFQEELTEVKSRARRHAYWAAGAALVGGLLAGFSWTLVL